MINENETWARVFFMDNDKELRESLLSKLKELYVYREQKGVTIKTLIFICIGVSTLTMLLLLLQLFR